MGMGRTEKGVQHPRDVHEGPRIVPSSARQLAHCGQHAHTHTHATGCHNSTFLINKAPLMQNIYYTSLRKVLRVEQCRHTTAARHGQFSKFRFAKIQIEGLKSQNHCLCSIQYAL